MFHCDDFIVVILRVAPSLIRKNFLVLSDRVGSDKFVGTDKTVEFGLVWQTEPLQNRKNSFWQTLIMTGLSLSYEFYFRLKLLTKDSSTICNSSLVSNRPVGSRFMAIFSKFLILDTENLQ